MICFMKTVQNTTLFQKLPADSYKCRPTVINPIQLVLKTENSNKNCYKNCFKNIYKNCRPSYEAQN